jgi:hypothetical protein
MPYLAHRFTRASRQAQVKQRVATEASFDDGVLAAE